MMKKEKVKKEKQVETAGFRAIKQTRGLPIVSGKVRAWKNR